MKKTTSTNLSKKIAQYGALTTIIAGAADASGQIIYTDVNPDEGGSGITYLLDMDNNSNTDFVIRHFNSVSTFGYYSQNVLAMGPAADSSSNLLSNSILATVSGNFKYPFALDAGYTISAGNTHWNNAGFQTLNYNSCSFSNSAWCGASDKYLGLRFKIGTNTHYGWARLDVALNGANWVIKDYAYNSVAGGSILAGDTGTMKVDETMAEKVEIISLNKTIALYNLPGNTSYRIINMTGQSVLEGSTEEQTLVIQNESLKTGVYVVELIDVASGDTMSKKVLL